MASQGQRFRRKALRRGYKVDEVDAFLDRVEATLAGEPVNPPAASQEVHDVVFRVRFGGYDEWQVDLHLDRVERQLAELEERGGPRGPQSRMPERMAPGGPMPDRLGPPDRMGPMMRDDRQAPMPPPMPPRPMPTQGGPPRDPYGSRYEEQTGVFGAGSFDGRGGYDGPPGPGAPGGYGGPNDRFDGFEPGRHGKMDMTAEIRMPDRPRPGMGGPPMPGSPMGGPPVGGPSMGGPGGGMGGDLQRVDQIRRMFQVRRFGSGYDPHQVDALFEGILTAMSGRGPMPVNPADLDTMRFGLVPGGYFEAEVDAALKEVQDILRGR